MTTAPQTAGPREQGLIDRKAREGASITLTEADYAHAHHVDNCDACQSGEAAFAYMEQELAQTEKARVIFVGGIHQIQTLVQAAVRGEAPPVTVEQITAALTKLSNASSKAWRG